MRRLSIVLCICLLAPDIRAALRGDHVAYFGGTASITKGAEGAIDLSDSGHLQFAYKGGSWTLPYASINSLEFGQKVGRRVGMTVGLGATVLGLLALPLLLSKKKRHFLTVGFREPDETNGGVVFELSKNVFQTIIPTLEARTGKKVEMQQDLEMDEPQHIPQPQVAVPIALRLVDVAVTSQPDGARIEFERTPAGQTPAVVKLQPGEYRLSLAKTGFQVWQQTMVVKPGEPAAISAVLVSK